MKNQLEQRLSLLGNAELIDIIESKDGDYTADAIILARKVLAERSLDESEVLQLARDRMKAEILVYLKGFDVINDSFVLPKSKLLTEVEVKPIFSQTFTQWKNEQDDMIPDGWQYVLAAGLG